MTGELGLLRRREADDISSVLPRSDGVGEFGKDRWELIVRRVKDKTLQLAEAEKQHR